MSDFEREKIEAVVRAFGREPGNRAHEALLDALGAPVWWWMPNGTESSSALAVASAWIAHLRAKDAAPQPDPLEEIVWQNAAAVAQWAKADAAKAAPAPADPLDGVVFKSAADVLRTAEQGGNTSGGSGLVEHDWQVFRNHPHAAIASHARAQLARESAPAQSAALTLEQARAMCRGAGDTVVEAPPRPNYVKPAEMLAWFEASVAVREADKHMGDAASRCAMQDRDAWTETPDDCTVESEIARLRALGVTPAVLS